MSDATLVKRRAPLLVKLLVLVVGLWLVWLAIKWTTMRVYVPHGKALLVINKYGDPLPPDSIVVPKEHPTQFKGVQAEPYGPGRYFINPLFYDTQLIDLTEIPAGDPTRWDWDPDGNIKDPSTAPMVGLVTLQEGRTFEGGQEVVPAGYKGLQQEVLTPGTYKINPRQRRVTPAPATIVPPGSVGVVTRLMGDVGEVQSVPLSVEPAAPATRPATGPGTRRDGEDRIVAGPTQRGVLKDVLQPGIYYLNPRMVKVSIMPVGYDEITLEGPANPIRFLSSDGYQVEADVTVIWGRTPADAPSIVANIGNTDDVKLKVVEQAIRAVCQNEGANFSARDLIEGETRSKFQDAIEQALEQQVASRNVHILIPLIRNIHILDARGTEQEMGLLYTIQRANIEIERELTNKQKTQTAMMQASYEQAMKLADVATEKVASETKLKVANLLAESNKEAAEISAEGEVTVANIQAQIAALEAERTEILGKAKADVERLKNEAEAKGAKLMVEAFGSAEAYNQYVFAKNFDPTELRLIFAGPGTFWTDLKTFEQVGASQAVKQQQQPATPAGQK
jgi:regulator of protease activity HflC (stomatin/prohibitin superfamily)